jgi:Skp family chaperone for outer membrane proteins
VTRTSLFAAGLVTAGLLVGASLVLERADADEQAATATRIMVLDVNKVFKNYDKYKTLADGLKTEIEGKEAKLREMEKKIRANMQAINSLKKREDRDRMEKQTAELKFNFEKSRRDYQEELVRREADIYSTIYKEMSDIVEEACKQNGIHLVIRMREETAGSKNPQGVLQTLQRQVVYNHPNLDLTQYVTDALNARYKQGQ